MSSVKADMFLTLNHIYLHAMASHTTVSQHDTLDMMATSQPMCVGTRNQTRIPTSMVKERETKRMRTNLTVFIWQGAHIFQLLICMHGFL